MYNQHLCMPILFCSDSPCLIFCNTAFFYECACIQIQFLETLKANCRHYYSLLLQCVSPQKDIHYHNHSTNKNPGYLILIHCYILNNRLCGNFNILDPEKIYYILLSCVFLVLLTLGPLWIDILKRREQWFYRILLFGFINFSTWLDSDFVFSTKIPHNGWCMFTELH